MKRALTLTTALFSAMSLSAFAGSNHNDDPTNMEKYDQTETSAAHYEQDKHAQKDNYANKKDASKMGEHKNDSSYQQNAGAETDSEEPVGFVNNNSLHREVEETSEAHSFSDYDLNNNGEIDKNEIFSVDRDSERFGEVEFDQLDTNDDEVVSAQEWNNHFRSSAAAN